MRILRFNYALIGLVALLTISFLFIKTQLIDINKHNRIIDRVSQFKQIDSVLNRHVLEIRLGLIPYYDSTVKSFSKLQQLQRELAIMMQQQSSDTNKTIGQRAESVRQALQQKRKALEAFKSSNAIVKNSLHYLPVATTQVVDQLSYNKQNNTLRQFINTLLHDIMVFNLTNDTELGEKLSDDLNKLSNDFLPATAGAIKSLPILIAHIRIVLDHKKQLDEVMQRLLTVPTT